LAKMIMKLMNAEAEILTDEERIRPEKSEVERLVANTEKAEKLTGWRARYTLEEGLNETINWFKENLEYYKPNIYNI